MSPRYDHRGPAVAFVVLFLVAVLVMGDQMLARAVGGTTFLAFDRAPRVLLAVRPAPREVRPTVPLSAVPPLMAVAAAGHATAPGPRAAVRRDPQVDEQRAVQGRAAQHPGRRLGQRADHRAVRSPHPGLRRADARPTTSHAVARVAHGLAAHRLTPPGLVRSVRQHPAMRDRVGPHRSHRPAGHAFGRARGLRPRSRERAPALDLARLAS